MTYTIVGVIGHIDHGKTSLVGVLTGVDTDTHPEEKLRGITIDLGFASFTDGEHEFALIDAPGHQKYIGNLLAGVSGIDVGLLVVACDQGIQEQTLEHAAILQTLGVKKLIAAISRIDLADEATRLGLAEELEVFLQDYGYTDVPTIPFSSVTGEGIETLKEQLREFARTADRSTNSFFRMPIDRVFSVPGRGCVVAGTLWSGAVAVGEQVELAGTPRSVRVRELEVHGESVERSVAGRRTAMNVTGVSASELSRGDELVAVGTNRPVSKIVVEVTTFPDAPLVKCPATVQFHSATSACSGRVSGIRQIKPGEQTVAVIETEVPIIATFGQQFLLRSPYPVGSFGGGRILAPIDPALGPQRKLVEFGIQLTSEDAAGRLCAWVDRIGEMDVDPTLFELYLGIARADCDKIVSEAIEAGRLIVPGADAKDSGAVKRVASPATLAKVRNYLVKMLKAQAEESDDAWLVEESMVQRARTTGSPATVRSVIGALVKDKKIVRLNNMLAIASDENLLSKKQKARMDKIIVLYDGDRTPPTIKEVADQMQTNLDSIASLVRFATQQRVLIDVGGGFLISRGTFVELCRELKELFDQGEEQSVAEIRDRWQVTRKHAIPFLEYFDKIGATARKENSRIAGPQLEAILSEETVE